MRQRLVAHPEWLRDVKFVSSRITAEVGPKPFEEFREHFEEEIGVEKVGVEQDGRPVDPAAGLGDVPLRRGAAGRGGARPARGARRAAARGAQPGQRSSAPTATVAATAPEYHEGVSPADVYIAGFGGFVFEAVEDDPLSGLLPSVDQLG